MDVREVLNGIFYVLSTRCQWEAMRRTCRPEHGLRLPRPVEVGGTSERRSRLYVACREQARRKAISSAAIMTARAPARPKKGRLITRRVRCGHES